MFCISFLSSLRNMMDIVWHLMAKWTLPFEILIVLLFFLINFFN